MGKINKILNEIAIVEPKSNLLDSSNLKNKVFLGGTCNDSKWRDDLIPMLEIEYFNPVVEDWTPDCIQEEERQKKECSKLLYTITPKMTGVYSIAEVVQSSNDSPEKTIFCILDNDMGKSFNEGQLRSLNAVRQLVEKNGAKTCKSLKEVSEICNKLNQLNKSNVSELLITNYDIQQNIQQNLF